MNLLIYAVFLAIPFASSSDDEDYLKDTISAEIELVELDLVDQCDNMAIATANALLGRPNGYKEKISTEQGYGKFSRDESVKLRSLDEQEVVNYGFKRNWTLLTKTGDTQLDEGDWNSLVSFHNANERLLNVAKVPCVNETEKCNFNKSGLIRTLETSRDVEILKKRWSAWQDLLFSSRKQFPSILNLVNKAAQLNGFSSANEYWEMLFEYPSVYEEAEQLWSQIEPLYTKFHSFVKTRLFRHYNISDETTHIPVYTLGSVFGSDWSNIADIVLPDLYIYNEITSGLQKHKVNGMTGFRHAENASVAIGFPPLRSKFWKESVFDADCSDQTITYCAQQFSQVITCNKTGWSEYVSTYEKVIEIGLDALDYILCQRERNRISGIREAFVSLAPILAVQNLPRFGILPENVFTSSQFEYENRMSALLLVALRILPRLPYYLAADKWRLEELETNSSNMSARWWELRQSMQGVESPANNEWDMLGDSYISSNKPYIGKFLGTVMMFQFLQNFDGYEIYKPLSSPISHSENVRAALAALSSDEWPAVSQHDLYIYEFDAQPLLDFFKPLMSYLEDVPDQVTRPSTTTTTTTQSSEGMVNKIISSPTQTIKPVQKPSSVSKEITKPAQKPTYSFEEEEIQSSNLPVWLGAGIGIVALVALIGFMIGRRCRRKKATPNNRRYDP